MARIVGLHHVQVAMPAGGEDDARRFYVDVLGLEEVPKPPPLADRGGCWFRGPGIELHLGVEEPFAPARKAHPALIVEDLDDLEGRLADSGHDTRPDAPIDVIRRFHASDPFGNRLEFMAPS